MQLTTARRLAVTSLLALISASSGLVRADDRVDLTATFFNEPGKDVHMTVLTPAVSASLDVVEALELHAGWEADIVSGASVAVVDNPASQGVDAVTTATVLDDQRHTFSGGATLRGNSAQIGASYGYGFESDYQSHSLSVQASAEIFERNTKLTIELGRGWDSVCDLPQPDAESAVERGRLPTSDGCFVKKDRTERSLDLQTLQGGWTQAWAPVFATQLVLTAQLLEGFQSNAYRAVWLGQSAAQEHHPEHRARYAVGLGARLWVKPLGGALQANGRLYRDTWDVASVSGELAFERALGELFRMRARGRYYTQRGAAFYSDDYERAPKGSYFTGDRDLSPMSSWLAGGQIEFSPSGDDQGKVLSVLDALELVLKVDALMSTFDRFHYGRLEVPTDLALFGTLSLSAEF